MWLENEVDKPSALKGITVAECFLMSQSPVLSCDLCVSIVWSTSGQSHLLLIQKDSIRTGSSQFFGLCQGCHLGPLEIF